VDTRGPVTPLAVLVVRASGLTAMEVTVDMPLPETLAPPMVEACPTVQAPLSTRLSPRRAETVDTPSAGLPPVVLVAARSSVPPVVPVVPVVLGDPVDLPPLTPLPPTVAMVAALRPVALALLTVAPSISRDGDSFTTGSDLVSHIRCGLISDNADIPPQLKEVTVDTPGPVTPWVVPVARATHLTAMLETVDTPPPETLALPMVGASTTVEVPLSTHLSPPRAETADTLAADTLSAVLVAALEHTAHE
jgi:hypothetical protein